MKKRTYIRHDKVSNEVWFYDTPDSAMGGYIGGAKVDIIGNSTWIVFLVLMQIWVGEEEMWEIQRRGMNE